MPTNNTENVYTHEYEDTGAPIPGTRIGYDNSETGLEATNMQAAIDELDGKIKASDEASEITYDNTESGLEAENVQDAVDELSEVKVDKASIEECYLLIDEASIDNVLADAVGGSTFANAFTDHKLREAIGTRLTQILTSDDLYIEITGMYIGGSDFVNFLNVRKQEKLRNRNDVNLFNEDLHFVGTLINSTNPATANVLFSRLIINGVTSQYQGTALTSTLNTTPALTNASLLEDTATREFSVLYKLYKKV